MFHLSLFCVSITFASFAYNLLIARYCSKLILAKLSMSDSHKCNSDTVKTQMSYIVWFLGLVKVNNTTNLQNTTAYNVVCSRN